MNVEIDYLEVNMCAVCLNEKCDLIAICFDESLDPNIGSVLLQHLWFQHEDLQFKRICEDCWEQVKLFHIFYSTVKKVHNELKIARDSAMIIEIEVEPQFLDKSNYCIKDTPLEKDSPTTMHMPATQLFENDDQKALDNVVLEEEHLELSEYLSSDSATDGKKLVSKALLEESREGNLKHQVKRKCIERIKNEDAKIAEHCNLQCEECALCFVNFLEFKRHFREVHQTRAFITCCNRKFSKRFRLVEHVTRHINPNAFKCAVCNKSYSNSAGLNLHMTRHKSSKSLMQKCNKCDRSFAKRFQLNAHQLQHLPEGDKKSICTICNKLFANISMLNVHTNLRHKPVKMLICDVCAKSFKVSSQLEKHRKEHDIAYAEVRMQCKICSKWMKNACSLRKHILRHDGEGSTHECNICGKRAPNVLALQSHISFVHKKEKLFQCNVCTKAFKRQFSLVEHMATHTGEVLYQCPFCVKTFNSSANMHSHKKKTHPREWEEWKRKSELPFIGKN
ncbi:transcription factor grauzone-like [Wyeomyia smithii]|uniref:transcription factor grauzone-like n=1 Tax=Wyeomyia smithii TaxID=174621 RepID=UPI002467DB20|nr:transcription factor grauzone-like [Wyeomyia smithii]XP_055535178.1 transcription factor grauzone-like [Wyeomyia smithii]XP_055535179.1 transcription factor grauzone-like [Wyeomyia smithii]XP_055535180.1 transcription factor grauzone-like [Wyeomyia smithii]XP_055535181.1 transcription factor grauzone-like [Wyeomyia smithii]XP_055535182.1 transcription factor grauzone-like [Wyeomyia smithii]XP_055535183.1 transcription factor grauzone-like [Wyeomyia smithii]XP_055535184.1 transcription fac